MSDKINRLQEFLARQTSGREFIKVLEAGCGSTCHLRFGTKAYTVGIDISEKQLVRNGSLNERIVGDIQHYHFTPSCFDVIACWDVLEHIPRPELALRKFVNAAAEKGMIILKLPNVFSVKGLVTKLLPHRLHVLFYRHVHGRKNAGRDDSGPFKTYLCFSIAPNSIRSFAEKNGFRVVYFDTFDVASTGWLQRNRALHTVYRSIKTFVRCVSFGCIGDSEFVMILQRDG